MSAKSSTQESATAVLRPVIVIMLGVSRRCAETFGANADAFLELDPAGTGHAAASRGA